MTIYSGFFPLKMVMFHSFLYVYQRVNEYKWRFIPGPSYQSHRGSQLVTPPIDELRYSAPCFLVLLHPPPSVASPDRSRSKPERLTMTKHRWNGSFPRKRVTRLDILFVLPIFLIQSFPRDSTKQCIGIWSSLTSNRLALMPKPWVVFPNHSKHAFGQSGVLNFGNTASTNLLWSYVYMIGPTARDERTYKANTFS